MVHGSSKSDQLVNELENRIHEETEQLLLDIRRIAPVGEPYVLFGDLFDDDDVQQYYESLIGTLKSAKKRGCITFKGQMLLKGMSDKVQVSIVETTEGATVTPGKADAPAKVKAAPPAGVPKAMSLATPKSTMLPPRPLASKPKPNIRVQTDNKENRNSWLPPRATFSPAKRDKKLPSRSGASTDTEPCDEADDVYGIGGWSDGDANPNIRRSPRRLVLPSVFLQSGRPPAPWKMRKTVSLSSVLHGRPKPTNSPLVTTPKIGLLTEEEVLATTVESTPEPVKSASTTEPAVASALQKKAVKPLSATKPKRVTPPAPKRHMSLPIGTHSSSSQKSAEIGSMVDDEVIRLQLDIRRIGSNPGEPSVTFGELFDDDEVQNTYEALVGTLRSAKRQGKIDFKGQMLLKGMHDSVVISVVEEAP